MRHNSLATRNSPAIPNKYVSILLQDIILPLMSVIILKHLSTSKDYLSSSPLINHLCIGRPWVIDMPSFMLPLGHYLPAVLVSTNFFIKERTEHLDSFSSYHAHSPFMQYCLFLSAIENNGQNPSFAIYSPPFNHAISQTPFQKQEAERCCIVFRTGRILPYGPEKPSSHLSRQPPARYPPG